MSSLWQKVINYVFARDLQSDIRSRVILQAKEVVSANEAPALVELLRRVGQ